MNYLSFLCTCILQNKIKHIDVFSFQQVFMHESQGNRSATGVKMFNRSLCLPRVWIKWIYLWPNSHKIKRVMSFWRDSIPGVCTLCLSAIKLSVSSQAAGMFPNDRSRNISIHCRLKTVTDGRRPATSRDELILKNPLQTFINSRGGGDLAAALTSHPTLTTGCWFSLSSPQITFYWCQASLMAEESYFIKK